MIRTCFLLMLLACRCRAQNTGDVEVMIGFKESALQCEAWRQKDKHNINELGRARALRLSIQALAATIDKVRGVDIDDFTYAFWGLHAQQKYDFIGAIGVDNTRLRPGVIDSVVVQARKMRATRGGLEEICIGRFDETEPNAGFSAKPATQTGLRTPRWLVRVASFGQGQGKPRGQDPQAAPETPALHFITVIVKPARKGDPPALVRLIGLTAEGMITRVTQSADADGKAVLKPETPATDPRYLVVVTKPGYQLVTESVTQDEQTIPIILPLAQGEETGRLAVKQAPAPLTFLSGPERGDTFSREQLLALPAIAPQNVDSFALLLPGVVPAPQAYDRRGPGLSPTLGSTGEFSANGLRSRANNFRLDGSDNNDETLGVRRQGFLFEASQPLESFGEVQINTGLYDARFGRNEGAQVNALSKSAERQPHGGWSSVHGEAFGYAIGDRANARNFFDPARVGSAGDGPVLATNGRPVLLDNSELRVANPAGTAGHLYRGTTGFAAGAQTPGSPVYLFASYEYSYSAERQRSNFAVPAISQRGIFDSGETGLTGTGGRRLAPATVVGNAIFSLYPFPNNPAGVFGPNTYTAVLPADANGQQGMLKGERAFGGSGLRHFLTGRYNRSQEAATIPSPGGALLAAIHNHTDGQSAAALLNTGGATFSNTFRFSWGTAHYNFAPPSQSYGDPLSPAVSRQFQLDAPLVMNVTVPGDPQPRFLTASKDPSAARYLPAPPMGTVLVSAVTGPIGQVRMPGFSDLGVDVYRLPQRRENHTLQWADNFTMSGRTHTWTAGFELWYVRFGSEVNRNGNAVLDFYGRQFSTSLGEGQPAFQDLRMRPNWLAAAGYPSAIEQTLIAQDAVTPGAASAIPDIALQAHRKQLDLYLQHDWKALPSLTFNMGIRFNFNRLPESNDPRFSADYNTQSLTQRLDQAPASCAAAFAADPDPEKRAAGQRYCLNTIPVLRAAFPAGFESVFASDQFGYDPRLGFAWDVFHDHKTVLRGGLGMYTSQFPAIILDESRSLFPRFLPLSYGSIAVNDRVANLADRAFGGALLQAGFDLRGILQPGSQNVLAATVDPIQLLAVGLANRDVTLRPVLPSAALKNAHSDHVGLTLERTLGHGHLVSVAYVGTRGRRLLRVSTPAGNPRWVTALTGIVGSDNTGLRDFPIVNIASRSPGASLQVAPTVISSGATSHYHSLQVEARGLLRTAGLRYTSAFTWSHAIDDASDFFDNMGSFALPQDSLRPSERASSNFDVRLRSVTRLVWDTPEKWKSWWARSWVVSAIATLQTGPPFTVNSIYDVNQDGNPTDRLDSTAGLFGSGDRRAVLLQPANPASLLRQDLPGRCVVNPPGGAGAAAADPGARFLKCDGRVGRNTFRAGGIANLDLAFSRTFVPGERWRFVLRTEAFNALNRPNFGIPVRLLEAPGFGTVTRTSTPNRILQFTFRVRF